MLHRIHSYLAGSLVNDSVTHAKPKTYTRYEQLKLRAPHPIATPLDAAYHMRKSARAFDTKHIPPEELSEILYYGAGVQETTHKKYHPSGGALYPLELYVVVNTTGADYTLYHYAVESHSLATLPETNISFQNVRGVIADIEDLRQAPAYIFMTCKWEALYARYKKLGYKLALMEAGHAMQNMQLAACATGFAACPFMIPDMETVNTFLDIHREDGEDFIYALALGYPKEK